MSDLSTLLNQRINAVRAIGTSPQVALRLIELGNDPEAELENYVEVVRLDAALSSRILAAVNSAWFAPRHPITTVKRALGLLGVNHTRALALSSCLSSLHTALKIDPRDAAAYWEASLCKAVAAKRLATLRDPKLGEEAFAIGLLQDIATAVFTAADPAYAAQLRNPAQGCSERLKHERATYGNDHARAGRLVGERLGLPPVYLDLIASHHDAQGIDPAPATPPSKQDSAEADCRHIAVASYIVSFLPHDMRCWSPDDAAQLTRLLAEQYPGAWPNAAAFFGEIQTELAALCAVLTQGGHKPRPLHELIEQASHEVSESALELVGQLQSLVSSQSHLNAAVQSTAAAPLPASTRADHDPLCGVLNRSGFSRKAAQRMTAARIAGDAAALAFFDLDKFRELNEQCGNDAGDAVLRDVAQRLQMALRQHDVVCRWGGDEFVVLLVRLGLQDCIEVARRTQQAVASEPIVVGSSSVSITMSGGMIWTPRVQSESELVELISQADRCLYEAKGRRGSMVCRERTMKKAA